MKRREAANPSRLQRAQLFSRYSSDRHEGEVFLRQSKALTKLCFVIFNAKNPSYTFSQISIPDSSS